MLFQTTALLGLRPSGSDGHRTLHGISASQGLGGLGVSGFEKGLGFRGLGFKGLGGLGV